METSLEIVQMVYAAAFWFASVLFAAAAIENWCQGQKEKAMQEAWRQKAWGRLGWAWILSGICMALM